MKHERIGILGAIPEEINYIIPLIENKREEKIGKRTFYIGKIGKHEVVLAYSRIGKVAAATTVSTLILHYNITQLIFTGVAGAIHPDVKIGDIVLARKLIQHDMNASPLMPRHEIPLLGKTYFEVDTKLLERSRKAANNTLLTNSFTEAEKDEFHLHHPTIHFGLIASGDLFFSTTKQKEKLNQRIQNILCVEMEGAAIAQICYEFSIPFCVMRVISDEANDESSIDFVRFIKHVGRVYSRSFIENLLK
ncbi:MULTISPECIES: 5'-methylthioadenosine/adenosylhomocysteine nucleosidase [Weeksella]|uniref:adenosylhomocysteine nucleosidase n=2 Tax=Weeksella virosa TaxID=1014 RepID=F0NZE8_WEEVC|nr:MULTISPECIES: 5'-methylthioadenosine/adenosylhomocysteine nucleosidase [Weeksella]ADX68295.1 MTA/SAH nucleosidase [Weeksella virosa DSM 16922]MDK7374602.1 5'-methylthioadenosine/adenosylhomocysteine nucleosidase [Weeksella virosa]OFM83079.1 5'-methylthioadenosine/S-adenosylhomocysteine nucleosidase [Weeksella sp. HMSC059D05]SUP54608.1 MTA/SAH nucleosidase [Weeksella virosa]VEH64068.1 MTA/SAH nucleosidase [Weeksella virosa]